MTTRTAESHPSQRRGLLAATLGLVAKGLFWLAMALLFSIVLEWVGMVFWWPEEGVQHSRDMLLRELAHLDEDFKRSVMTSHPAAFAQRFAEHFHHYLFEKTGVIELIQWIHTPPAAGETGLRPRLHGLYWPVATFVTAGMAIVQVFAVRLAILVLALPVFVLFGLLAIIDGLVQRDLRKWGGGRESSFVYHHAKRSITPFVVLAWVVYLALPISLHPSFIVLPFATLFAVALAITTSTFKKYL